MASEAPKKAPGKLKFNAAMFNKAMGNQKPGAKNPLEQKKKSGPPKPLKPPEDQFSRPTAPRRRVKSKHKLDLDAETKEEANKFYNQSFIAQTEQESKDNSDESDPNTTQNTADNPTDDAEDTNTDDNHTNDAEDTNTDDVTNKLDSALQDRASKDELHDKQILKHPKIDASLQPQADNLEKQLETRTPVSPGYVDDKVAPALAAAAKALDRNLRSDRVSQALKPEKRSTVQSLQDQGVLQSTNVAPSLAATSRLLDKKLTTDKLNQKLGDDDRKTFDELTDKGVIPHSNLSYNLRQNAKKLEQAQRKDQVSKGLKDRQSVDDLHESGVYAAHPHEVAPSMHGAASDLQKSMQKDAVSQGLRDRQTVEELHESGVLAEYPSAMAPSMHSAAKNLRVSMNKDQLRQGLRDRQTVDELYESGVLTSNPHQIAPSIHAVKNDLQKKMTKDSLKQCLRDRAKLEALHRRNITTDNVDPCIAAQQRALAHAMKVCMLNEKLVNPERPDKDDLVEQGIMYSSTMAPGIQSKAKDLELKLRLQKDRRPSVHDLVAQETTPEDQAVIDELKSIAHKHKRMKSAVMDLATHLPFDEEINKSVAATLLRHVNATEEDVDLEDCDTDDLFSDNSDNDYSASSDIEDNKKNKQNIKELEEHGVPKQIGLAHSLRGSAVALEERLNKKMTHLELVARNIIKRPSICNSLQPNADALEAALIRDRPDTDDLVEQGILYSSTMAPATQSKAKVLELKLQQGIMYSSTMAPGIQSKAKDLELKLRLHKDGIQDEEQKCNDNNEHKKEEDEDEDERVEKQFKLFLKKCKTMRYFDKFVENECCNMESIRYFDDEFLSQDIGMKSKILRKTFLRQCNKVVQKMDAFENNYGINEVL
eukprot:730095_1